jgi:GTP:adenosylcobinamide-phosphate guanylyltransferase
MTVISPLFTALVPAGQRPGRPDPLAFAHGVAFKAQVPVLGLPMLTHVIRTLLASPEIGDIHILAQEPKLLLSDPALAWLALEKRIRFVVSGNSISATVHDLLARRQVHYPVLLTTSDHVLLTPEMIAYFAEAACTSQADVCVAMVKQQVLHAAYPDNQRTWLNFADGGWSGANLFGFFSDDVLPALNVWKGIEQDRKKGWKIVSAFGFSLLIRVLLKSLTLPEAMAAAGKRLGLKAALVAMPMAEACIDVDKESDLVLADQILAARKHG